MQITRRFQDDYQRIRDRKGDRRCGYSKTHKKAIDYPTLRNEAQTPLGRVNFFTNMGRESGSVGVGEERLRKPDPDRGRTTQSERSQNTC